jgi:hypothetical protein
VTSILSGRLSGKLGELISQANVIQISLYVQRNVSGIWLILSLGLATAPTRMNQMRNPSLLRTIVHNGWIATDMTVYLGLSLAVAVWTVVGARVGKALQIPQNELRGTYFE